MKRALQGAGLIPLVPLLISSFLVKERAGHTKMTFRGILHGKPFGTSPSLDSKETSSLIESLKTTTHPTFLGLSAALFFIYGGYLVPFNYIPLFAEFNGQGSMGNNLLAICYSGSVVGRIGTGALADRFGR